MLFTGLLLTSFLLAQPGVFRNLGRGGMPSMGGRGQGGGSDSLKHRNNLEDSITITFRYIDSTRNYTFDSSISDFTKRFPIPATHVFLGNTGSPTHSLLFAPSLRTGWDPGFHALDVYKWKLEDVRFFNTTRPYTELSYLLGSKVEQIIEVQHTQNLKPYWNASFRYRLINSPGFFKNQKNNHNNYLLTSWYQAPKKRYNNYFVVLANSLQANESGGIKDDINYLKDPVYSDRFNIPTKIGGDAPFGSNFFSSNITTGNKYKELNILMRQQYDFGKKDSIVTDSTVIPLFYPRLRFEHTFNFGKYNYQFLDVVPADADYYSTNYNLNVVDSFSITDHWQEISNDFSIYQFPDAKNLSQFIKAGIEYQNLIGTFTNGSKGFYNFIGHGEYRNRTRNQKWDIEAFGSLHLNGYNAGDYNASISLQRLISPTIGSLQIGFQNANSSPSFIFDNRSSFYMDNYKSFAKENVTHAFAAAWQPKLKLQLSADYYLIGNYLYITDFYKLQQENTLFTVLRINALKTFKLGKHWNWYSEVYLQQKTGNAQINFPLLYTRNRIALEGLFYRNLNLSTGLEIRYHSPYNADNYSPVLGQFFYQNTYQINNRPDVAAFLHFRIRSFKAYVRAENLNSFGFLGGSGVTKNNLAAKDYPYPGFLMRFGFYWSFVN